MPGRHSSEKARRSLAGIVSVFAVIASVVPWSLATSASAATPLFGGFEIDGTLVSGDNAPPGLDWSDSGTVGTQPVKTDPIGGADNSVFTGSKESQPSGWNLKTNAPAKDDIGPIYFFNRIDPATGHQFLYFGFERASNVGTVNYVVELNQKPNKTNSHSVSIPDRTAGDLRFNVTQNGNQATLAGHGVDQFDGTQYVPFNNPPAAFDSAVNTKAIPPLNPADPIAAANGGNIPAGQFAEFAFDMTALTPAGKPCSIPPFSELNSRSRASDSNTAEVKDMIDPLSLKLPGSCFDLTIKKFDDSTPAVALAGATFTIDPDPADGTSAAITVTDGDPASDPDKKADGVIEFPNAAPLGAGNGYTVTETVAPDGYLLASPDNQTSTDALAFHTDTLSFTDSLGSVTFTKVDGDNANAALPGASFTLTGTSGAANGVIINVADGDSNDADGADDGSVTVDGLVTGGWSLTEHVPPPGYDKDTSTKTFTIGDPPTVPAVVGVSGRSVTLADPTFVDHVSKTPGLTITKSDDVDPVSVGDTLKYTLAVSNPGNGDTTGTVEVTDTVPVGLTVTDASGTDWDCSATLGNDVDCVYTGNGGVLAATTDAPDITVTTTVLSSAIPAGSTSHTISNTANVDDTTDKLHDDSTETTRIVAPDLAITKVSSVDPATVGAEFHYTLSVQNVGDGPVRASDTMTVTDTIPASLTIGTITAGAWNCVLGGGTLHDLTCTLAGPLASGASTPDDIVVNVTPTVEDPALSNTGTVDVANDPNSANNQSTATIAVQNTPAQPGASFTDSCGPPKSITVALTNDGGTPEDVTVTRPDGVTTDIVTVPAHTNPATLATTKSYDLTGAQNQVSAESNLLVKVTHTFSLNCVGPPPPPTPPNLTLVKSSLPASGGTVQIGDSITYTLDFANTGGSDATGSLVSDPLPADVTFVSASNGGSYDSATNTVSWALGTIQPGTSGTVSFVVKVASTATDGEVITNVGAISAAGVAPVSSNPVTVTVNVPVTPPTPTLDIEKQVNKSSAEFGDTLKYSFTVQAGGVDQTGVTVTDTIPDGTTYVANSATCSTGCSASLSNGVLSWAVGDLAQGASVDLSFKVTIDTPASAADGSIPPETIHNFGLVNSHELVDPVESNRVKTDVIAVLPIHVVRPPHHSPLPFTGLPVGLVQLLTMAVGAVGIGSLMVRVARSRRRIAAGIETPLDE